MLKLMRILLVGNYMPDAQQSMARYAEWLERALTARGHQVTLLRPKPFFSRLTRHGTVSKYLGYLDKFLLFPPSLRKQARGYDLVHILDHANSMYLGWTGSTPNLITCHDLLEIRAERGELPLSPTGWSGHILQRWIFRGLLRARHLLCVSQKTADDLKRLVEKTGPAQQKMEIRMIYNTLNWPYRPGMPLTEELAAKVGLLPGEAYILHVGGNQWYKNRIGAVRIFSLLRKEKQFANLRMVLAGKPWTAALRAAVDKESLKNQVIEATGLGNDELQALYGNALALLFPSVEEGFGWPILEAQACGCPVVTTARPPMSEVAGNAAILIDPDRPEAAATLIAQGLSAREDLRADGLANLRRFDQETILRQYCAFYAEILGRSPVLRRQLR